MARSLFSSIEPLESRIAPAALATVNPIADMVAGYGKTGTTIDLGQLYDTAHTQNNHTYVEFVTNFDTDPGPGVTNATILLELYNDVAPLTVQNFLNYVNSTSARGDYNGIFFHRSVNSPADPNTGAQNLQILQAGGFEAANPSVHIPIGPTMPNEYNLPNTTGTIALAKVGGNPNSGSSEFFFNMGDNSTTLGPANESGYTVFGKVVQGFDMLQQIYAQPLVNESAATKNGALGTVPYQGNFNTNPDNNLVTPSPALGLANYIQITSAKVVQGQGVADYVSPGLTFEVSAPVKHGTTDPATFVTPKLTGDNLALAYNTKSTGGVADITVTAKDANGGIVGTDTFSVTLLPNLGVSSVTDTFSSLTGPGDSATVKTVLLNNGDAALSGTYDITYYKSKLNDANDTDQAGATLDPTTDTFLGTFTHTVNIASGKTLSETDNLTLPTIISTDQSSYRIIATVTPHGDGINELYTNDQTLAGGQHTSTNTFGTLLNSSGQVLRKSPSITYIDPLGNSVTATLNGPGEGQLSPVYDTNNNVVALTLDLFDTTAATSFTVTPSTTAHTVLDTIRVDNVVDGGAAVGTLKLGNVDVIGSVILTGGVKSLSLGSFLLSHASAADPTMLVTNEHFLTLGSSPSLAKVQPTITAGDLNNTVITSDLVVKSLSATSWANTDFSDTSLLPGVKTLTITGDLHANLAINSKYGNAAYVNTDPSATAATTTFKVGGTLANSNINVAGNIGTVDLGAIASSEFVVGADTAVTDVSQFNNLRTIVNFIVRGVAGKDFSLSDSDIVAANFTTINIKGALDTSVGNDNWGFVADKIGTYTRAAYGTGVDAVAAVTFKNLTTGSKDVLDKYAVVLV